MVDSTYIDHAFLYTAVGLAAVSVPWAIYQITRLRDVERHWKGKFRGDLGELEGSVDNVEGIE